MAETDVEPSAEAIAEHLPDDVTAADVEQVVEFIGQLIRDSPALVSLPRERWDHVIHSLEENIDQLYGPREPVETEVGTVIEPTEELSAEQREEIEDLEETLELIMEQVVEGGD